MTTNEIQQQINAALHQWQQVEIFPTDGLPHGFHEVVTECLSYHSAISLRISHEAYKQIAEVTDNRYTLLQMGTIQLIMKLRTAVELGLPMDEYIQFQDQAEAISKHYESLCQAEGDRLGGN